MRNVWDFTLERATQYPQLAARSPSFPAGPKETRDQSVQLHARDSLMRDEVLSELDGNFTLKVGQKRLCLS